MTLKSDNYLFGIKLPIIYSKLQTVHRSD